MPYSTFIQITSSILCWSYDVHEQHLQLFANSVNEERPAVLSGVLHASALHFIANSTNDVLQLITFKLEATACLVIMVVHYTCIHIMLGCYTK